MRTHTPDSTRGCTIDELTALAGVPTRTIREYQRMGLLPPPQREGRVGKYGPDHITRLVHAIDGDVVLVRSEAQSN